jgi:hypothetical protein
MASPELSAPVDWRCTACHTLIGIASGESLQVKYKTVLLEISGSVTTHCRRCGTPAGFDTRSGPITH